MIPIDEGEVLAKVQTYELVRGKERFFIDVCEIIAGESPYRFWAFPNLIFVKGRRRYFGKGHTEREALRDCLRRVHAVAMELIFPDLQDDSPKGPGEVLSLPL